MSDDGVHQQRVSSAKDFEHVVEVQCSSGRRSVKQHSSWHSRWALTDAVSSHVARFRAVWEQAPSLRPVSFHSFSVGFNGLGAHQIMCLVSEKSAA